jgi:hypothetical protein
MARQNTLAVQEKLEAHRAIGKGIHADKQIKYGPGYDMIRQERYSKKYPEIGLLQKTRLNVKAFRGKTKRALASMINTAASGIEKLRMKKQVQASPEVNVPTVGPRKESSLSLLQEKAIVSAIFDHKYGDSDPEPPVKQDEQKTQPPRTSFLVRAVDPFEMLDAMRKNLKEQGLEEPKLDREFEQYFETFRPSEQAADFKADPLVRKMLASGKR